MQKIKLIGFSMLVIISILLSACAPAGQQQAEIVLVPSDPNTVAGGGTVISVDNRPTLQVQYDACASGIDYNNPEFEFILQTEEGQKATQLWNCGVSYQSSGEGVFVMVAVNELANLTPSQLDNAVVYAVEIIAGVGIFAILMYGAYVAGQQIADYNSMAMIDARTLSMGNLESEFIYLEVHDSAHDVLAPQNLPHVQEIISAQGSWVTTGGSRDPRSNRDFLCRALVIAGKAVRYTLWSKLYSSVLVWAPDGTWITYFENQPISKVNKVPDNIQSKYPDAQMQPVDCNTLPPFPPLGA